MNQQGITVSRWPALKYPVLVAGFDGWGNALNVSKGTVSYFINKFKAETFAHIRPDPFYRYDENRPLIIVDEGKLNRLSPPGGEFYSLVTGGPVDLIFLLADEPSMNWFRFAETMFHLCERMGVQTVITLGGMFDDVLHTDKMISAISPDDEMLEKLKLQGIKPVSYQGPGAIHSIIQVEGEKRGISSLSLWAHCPYYIEDMTHFGMMAEMGRIIAEFGEFEADLEELSKRWHLLTPKIEGIIAQNPSIQSHVEKLKKEKERVSRPRIASNNDKNNNIIQLKDFLKDD